MASKWFRWALVWWRDALNYLDSTTAVVFVKRNSSWKIWNPEFGMHRPSK